MGMILMSAMGIWILVSLILFISTRIMRLGDISLGRCMLSQLVLAIGIIAYAFLVLFLNINGYEVLNAIVGVVLSILIFSWMLNISLLAAFGLTLLSGILQAIMIVIFVLSFGLGMTELNDSLKKEMPMFGESERSEPYSPSNISNQSVLDD